MFCAPFSLLDLVISPHKKNVDYLKKIISIVNGYKLCIVTGKYRGKLTLKIYKTGI